MCSPSSTTSAGWASWDGDVRFASDYFDRLYGYAVELIQAGKAYVDDLSAEEMRQYRGSLTEPGKNSPYRERSVEENLDLFARMKNGEFADGSKTLRLKIDMSSGNINLRDPAIYRIRRAHHHRTGDKWCIYPMYDYTHCISDAIEGITHSLCTLEFEDHRPLYDWVLDNISIGRHPRQYESSRLELLYTLTSKRKLLALVNEGAVSGWDDPRMPTVAGMRRRGYSPAGIAVRSAHRRVQEREHHRHGHPGRRGARDAGKRIAARDGGGESTESDAEQLRRRRHRQPQRAFPSASSGVRRARSAHRPRDLDRARRFRRSAAAQVAAPDRRRRSAPALPYVIKCEEVVKDAAGEIIELKCSIDHDTLGKNPEGRKVKGVIHWVSAEHAIEADVRWYDRLFTEPRPDAVRGEDGEYVDFRQFLNPESLKLVPTYVEASVLQAAPESRFQFERLGYFVTDRYEHQPGVKAVFNRSVGLKDSWSK